MPFTPFHMGPALVIKALMQTSFSLMVFGWTQIVMDIQPLIVLITGQGHLHGFTHTFIGASILAFIAGITGKYLAQFALNFVNKLKQNTTPKHGLKVIITWPVVMLSAFIGSFSHVLLDAIMHTDVEPFFPFTLNNEFLGLVSVLTLHKVCLYSGMVGTILYFIIHHFMLKKHK